MPTLIQKGDLASSSFTNDDSNGAGGVKVNTALTSDTSKAYVPKFATGTALPTSDQGVIYHADYGLMRWNGTAYAARIWRDVLASRSPSVTYTNTSGAELVLKVLFSNAVTDYVSYEIFLNGTRYDAANTPPGALYTPGNGALAGNLIVPPGNTYQVNAIGPSTNIYKWLELSF